MNFIKLDKRYYSKNALLYLCAVVFFYVASGGFNMLQGIYIRELKVGEDFLGIIISSRTLAIALSAFPCALFVNKLGKKNAIFISMFFICITMLLQGYFKDKWLILIFAVTQGLFNALLGVTEAPFLMANSSGEGRIKIFSYTYATSMFSMMLGYFLFGHGVELLAKRFSVVEAYRYSIIIASAIGLISLLFVLIMKSEVNSDKVESFSVFKNSLLVIKSKNVRSFLNFNFIIGFGAGLVVPYFNVYLKYKINISTDVLGTIMSISQVAMGIGGLLTPFMAKKFGKVKTIIICQIVSIPFLLLIATPPSIMIVSIAFFMRSALMNMPGPVINNMSMELVEDVNRPVFSSLMNLSSNFSRAISAAVAGFIMKNIINGYEIPYYITTALYVFGTVYFYRSFKNHDKIGNSKQCCLNI